MPEETAIQRYGAYFEVIQPYNLEDLRSLVTADVHFVDPFNDVRGADAMIAVFGDMFETTIGPRFSVLHSAASGGRGYLRWRFEFTPRKFGKGGAWAIDGVSEVSFDESGRVSEHIDHWDAGMQFYARLPVLGWAIQRVRRRLAA